MPWHVRALVDRHVNNRALAKGIVGMPVVRGVESVGRQVCAAALRTTTGEQVAGPELFGFCCCLVDAVRGAPHTPVELRETFGKVSGELDLLWRPIKALALENACKCFVFDVTNRR